MSHTIKQRIVAIDAARGCAIFLACLSHIKEHFGTGSIWYWWIAHPTRIATPTFLLLSGFIIGHLLRIDPRGSVRLVLLDRGIFLLVVVHLLFGIMDLPQGGPLQWLFGRAYITDVFGIALLAAVLLRAASTRALIALGAAMCLGSWWAVMTLGVQHGWNPRLVAVLFDVRDSGKLLTSAPLIPYLGVFLIGMALSSHLKSTLLANADRAVARRLTYFGAFAIFIVVIGMVAWRFGHEYLPQALLDHDVARHLRATLDLRGKRPPSPAYLLFYGGASLLLLAVFLRGQPQRLLNPVIRMISVVGRASLMCFVAQDWLLLLVPQLFGFSKIPSVTFWFSYLGISLMVLYGFAKRWDDNNGNRFLTIGLKAFARQRSLAERSVRGTSEVSVRESS